jgi:futalosine hydrolase
MNTNHNLEKTKTLVCAATLPELQTFPNAPSLVALTETNPFLEEGAWGYLVTGVGIPASLATLLQTLHRFQPDLILNIGIAGAYPESGLSIGQIVLGTSDTYGDIGFELPQAPHFQNISDSPFAGTLYAEPLPLTLAPQWTLPHTATGRGSTVNTCTGTEAQGKRREKQCRAQFETMEGAAVAQVGKMLGIPVCQVRAISNIAAERDMRFENIRIALSALRTYLAACYTT